MQRLPLFVGPRLIHRTVSERSALSALSGVWYVFYSIVFEWTEASVLRLCVHVLALSRWVKCGAEEKDTGSTALTT